jgi:hypothetical protein
MSVRQLPIDSGTYILFWLFICLCQFLSAVFSFRDLRFSNEKSALPSGAFFSAQLRSTLGSSKHCRFPSDYLELAPQKVPDFLQFLYVSSCNAVCRYILTRFCY